VLAHHYLQALELAAAAGESVAELTTPARRFLALAGERALGLDTAQAEAKLARALELTPLDTPERVTTLTTWADAAFQAGRAPEAAEALDDLLPILRSRGPTEAAARALQLRSRVSQRLGEGKQVELAAEAVSLLEHKAAGTTLIGAYEQLANVQMIAGAYNEAIGAADRASALAEALAAPEPARALGYRGFAKAYLGETLDEMERGLDEMERALAVLIDRGAGRDAAILQNNLAIARYPLHGPSRSLADFAKGIEFCEQRGLREVVWQLEANRPGLLAELGRMSEALDDFGQLMPILDERGDTYTLVEVRSVEVGYRLARGQQASAAEVEWLIETARTIGTIDILVMGLSTAAAAALANANPKHACSLLSELGGRQGSRATPYFARGLPGMVRTALGARDRGLAERLAEGIVLRNPLNDRALCAVRAALLEHAAEHAEAVMLYAEATELWRTFGNVPECAYALLGRGRCLTALGEPGAENALHEARELFVSMGYKPALMETEALLDERERIPRSRGSIAID
jgi:tetratricopeptide (TPR) repeat protein